MARSDGTEVPGNRGLSEADKAQRELEIMRPYHDAIDRLLDRRQAAKFPTAIVSMHSCTPRLAANMKMRPWHIGVIAHQDWRIGEPLLALLAEEPELCVGRNEPYTVDIAVDYTVPVHCEGRGLPYVEIEIRQDLIGEAAGQQQWAERLARILPRVVDRSGVLGA
jgi:predicted N-formylglutamate amidohydrolase